MYKVSSKSKYWFKSYSMTNRQTICKIIELKLGTLFLRPMIGTLMVPTSAIFDLAVRYFKCVLILSWLCIPPYQIITIALDQYLYLITRIDYRAWLPLGISMELIGNQCDRIWHSFYSLLITTKSIQCVTNIFSMSFRFRRRILLAILKLPKII